MACEDDFCENYLVIKPEQASCLDLVRILCSDDLEKRDFFNTRVLQGGSTRFRHRWIVFISVLLQKVLLYLKKPVASVGSAVELLLNFPAANGGYRRLFCNLFTGRVVRPDKSSATYTSVSGNVDKRLDLDKNYQELNTTYAMMFQDKNVDPDLIIISFRGTEPFDTNTWRTDIDISWYEFQGIGKIHGGFMKALGLQKSTGWPKDISSGSDRKSYAYYTIREKLKTLVQENGNAKFILTGHSMGGALAILFAGVLAIHEEELLLKRLEGVYTFGQPRVGDEQFGEYMKGKMMEHDVKYFRYVYSNDMVLEEEPNKNYFSLLHVVPKILNAVYELIRGFILPWTKGEEYREGWFMKLFRVTALVIPGLTDHFLVDYVNLTRLGKLPSSIYVYPRGPNQNPKQD
ncbi:hypothetical protein DH2020_008182 [Rehmannia glutinosa]|uniref:Fungal lipase-type domain-containing protein n=1 Tax=Rehmannia glutinosa TaxID=99300 RepID=A0ABR0U087_REHGL